MLVGVTSNFGALTIFLTWRSTAHRIGCWFSLLQEYPYLSQPSRWRWPLLAVTWSNVAYAATAAFAKTVAAFRMDNLALTATRSGLIVATTGTYLEQSLPRP